MCALLILHAISPVRAARVCVCVWGANRCAFPPQQPSILPDNYSRSSARSTPKQSNIAGDGTHSEMGIGMRESESDTEAKLVVHSKQRKEGRS